MGTWSMSRSNWRSNVKFGSKIISIFVSSQSATSQHNRLPTSVMLFPNLSAEDRECLFSPCNNQGALQTFKTVAVQKIVAISKAKRDELYKTLSETDIFFAHKSCYSKSRNNERKKRKYALAHTVVTKRLLTPSVVTLCSSETVCCVVTGNVCKMKDSNNPRRWVQVRQCKTVNRGSAITFKQQSGNPSL